MLPEEKRKETGTGDPTQESNENHQRDEVGTPKNDDHGVEEGNLSTRGRDSQEPHMLSGHHPGPEITVLLVLHYLLKYNTIQKSTQIIKTQLCFYKVNTSCVTNT